MAAPKGNKNAIGNEGGRPCKFNKEEEFKALLEWAKTDEALVFRMFPCSRGYSHDTLQTWAEEKIEFSDIYNVALEMVGARRELLLIKSASPSPFQRYATYYDKKLKKHEREEKEFDSALKQKEEGTKATTINLTVPHDLGAGLNIPTKTIPVKDPKGSE